MPLLDTISSPDFLTIYFVPEEIRDALLIVQLQDELLSILGQTEKRNVLLDFRDVRFLSSAALGMLLRASKCCDEAHVNLRLCNIAPGIREIFKITYLDKTFEIYATAEDAKRAFADNRQCSCGRVASDSR